MGSLLRLIAVIFVLGMCISDNKFAVVVVDGLESFSFPDHYCSSLWIDDRSGLGRARDRILVELVKRHYSPGHRNEQFTCVRRTVQGSTMWAQSECSEPASKHCIGCLVYATSYLNSHCRYFSGGRVTEKSNICSMRFADYDVCATL